LLQSRDRLSKGRAAGRSICSIKLRILQPTHERGWGNINRSGCSVDRWMRQKLRDRFLHLPVEFCAVTLYLRVPGRIWPALDYVFIAH